MSKKTKYQIHGWCSGQQLTTLPLPTNRLMKNFVSAAAALALLSSTLLLGAAPASAKTVCAPPVGDLPGWCTEVPDDVGSGGPITVDLGGTPIPGGAYIPPVNNGGAYTQPCYGCGTGGGYVPPAPVQNQPATGGGYQPPVNNGGGYQAPVHNGFSAPSGDGYVAAPGVGASVDDGAQGFTPEPPDGTLVEDQTGADNVGRARATAEKASARGSIKAAAYKAASLRTIKLAAEQAVENR